ncbi:tRNA-dihydrouridine(16/17) synthase [NAD(P)(+)] [Malassezia vespertilionis]|uniref:tRNA-dihydrouridine(16/17) synthase [NAD(P)(+)] n=1 Tax=Malassezia vespertilionis TaxID=2020962 RepID=UPI0024B0F534|nr:tRNA-dihydrouridine(16/17) synthase [NAD(P)(+)] [Malassezia vespertilionis]WFD05208.1 tRNA-dihydrouridine(16/17) synthase [NAD(P)(+)] [Malassezia vespertilionis]
MDARPWWRYVAAPMVNQSDLAFRLTAVHYGATATWTQMYHTQELEQRDVYETLVHALEQGRCADAAHDAVTGERTPQIVQLAGDDPQQLADAAKKVAAYADGIDLNLGCPQRRAKDGHYGAYLLARREWPLVEQLTSALAHATPLVVSTKIRLCDYAPDTVALALRLAHAGSSFITLHGRHVAINRRRAHSAKLEYVAEIRRALLEAGAHASQQGGSTRVLSNGNVRCWDCIVSSLEYTGADGIMVGEPLLEQPSLFSSSLGRTPTWRESMHTYLRFCRAYPLDSLPISRVHQHVQYMVRGGLPHGREARRWEDALKAANSVDAMLALVEAQ